MYEMQCFPQAENLLVVGGVARDCTACDGIVLHLFWVLRHLPTHLRPLPMSQSNYPHKSK